MTVALLVYWHTSRIVDANLAGVPIARFWGDGLLAGLAGGLLGKSVSKTHNPPQGNVAFREPATLLCSRALSCVGSCTVVDPPASNIWMRSQAKRSRLSATTKGADVTHPPPSFVA
jgi:hypothetical protein